MAKALIIMMPMDSFAFHAHEIFKSPADSLPSYPFYYISQKNQSKHFFNIFRSCFCDFPVVKLGLIGRRGISVLPQLPKLKRRVRLPSLAFKL